MLPFTKATHAKEIGWRFFPSECVDTNFRPSQNLSSPLANSRYGPDGRRIKSLLDVYIDEVTTRPLLQDFGQTLARHLGGTFILGPDKTRDQALNSLLYGGAKISVGDIENDADQIIDFRRGCILADDNHALIRARKKLREIADHEQSPFVQIIDRYSRPPHKVPLRGIFAYAVMPNDEITEIQIHTRAYWEELTKTHAAYEAHRALRAQKFKSEIEPYAARIDWAHGKEHTPLAPTWDDEARGQSRRARSARREALEQIVTKTNVDKLELASKNYAGDCSFPLRPAVVGGQQGYMVATTYLGAVISKDYPYWDPTWHPSHGPRPEE